MAPKILIVGEMTGAIGTLPERCERDGCDVRIALQAAAGLALAEETQPDVIVLDTVLPDIDPITVCRLLRLNPLTAAIPVLLLSDHDSDTPLDARPCSELAVHTGHISDDPDILIRIRHLVGRARSRPDYRRVLNGLAYMALALLRSDMVWFLALDADRRCLEHQTVVMKHGREAMASFHDMIQVMYDGACIPLAQDAHLLNNVVRERRGLLNVPRKDSTDQADGSSLHAVFSAFGFDTFSLLPLLVADEVVGVMVLASGDTVLPESRRMEQLLSAVTRQAALVIDHARLWTAFAQQDAQSGVEQTFHQLVLETVGDGVLVVGEDATITYANNRLLALTGYRRENLYGQHIGVLFHSGSRQALGELLYDDDHALPLEQELHTLHGETVPVLVSHAAAPASNGRSASAIVVVTDFGFEQRHEDALHIQSQRLQAINQAMVDVSSASSFEDVVRIMLASALQIVRGETALLLLRDIDQLDMLTAVSALGAREENAGQRRVKVGEGVSGEAAASGEPRLVANVALSPVVQADYSAIYGQDIESVVAVPLIAFDEVIGVLEVVDKTPGPSGTQFDVQDLRMLESLAGVAAITIENTRLFEQTRERVTALSTLLDASSAVTSTLDFSDILERIARRLGLALHVQRVVLASWDRLSDRLALLSALANAYWTPADGPRHVRYALPVTNSVIMAGFATEHLVMPGDNSPVERNPSGLYALAAFSLMVGEQVAGAVTLYHERPEEPLAMQRAEAVREVIDQWHTVIGAYASDRWLSRPNLTDLCQRVLDAAGMRWVSVTMFDHATNQLVLLREMGYALWTGAARRFWAIDRYPTLARVLQTGEPLVVQRDRLHGDPEEQAYLEDSGGHSALIAPLMMRGESGGLVKLIDTENPQRDFDNAELSLCQGIANVVGNAMENAQLFAVQEHRASALEAAYAELQEADQLKEDLLQNLSHELRTPLTHILGYLRLMLDGAFGELGDEQQETLELITDKAEDLATLVKDIVSVSESERQNLMPKAIHLDRVIATAIRTTTTKAQSHGIRIRPRIPANLPLVYADPVRVGEVFEELIENAIKFSQDATRIDVTVEDPGGLMLRASVRDYGIGIPPGEHEKIFRRFYQVESGTTRRFGGTGLGLTIVRQVVEGHSGRVWVESTPDEGSCFYLTLPKATEMAEKA